MKKRTNNTAAANRGHDWRRHLQRKRHHRRNLHRARVYALIQDQSSEGV